MSGDVTAAIEADLPHARETWAIGRGVFQTETDATYIDRILAALPSLLAEVARLRAEVERQRRLLETRARVIRRAIGAEEERTEERDDARAEVERVRAERDRATGNAEDFEGRYETAHAKYMHALKVIDQYEAEREALHGRIVQATDEVLQSAHSDRFALRDAVLSVLTADPETDQ